MKKFILAALALFSLAIAVPVSGAFADDGTSRGRQMGDANGSTGS